MKKIQFGFFKTYFEAAILLFFTELLIARFAHDSIIRPYGGDLLVVVLIYCSVKSFVNMPVAPATLAVLLFAYAVEITQYFHLIRRLGWEHSTLACQVLGSSFSFADMLLYTIGAMLIITVENIRPAGKRVSKV
ncbi:ribosomal maturation YjgA family protein [Mucilaginibacter ginsenosidivorans]|uniref:DUF2809 domain-containing protein n=1 Tax=Mucilaginibacter ginsenosidivorans TaxID=398053 RepID=A0A5B8UXU9_9SPHI|nr:DUF2809 domain-containing protein [Mucilaginibacter ginsenosidivorans]QEC63515.1 DUF2809 domain-containing protein [Mucilaginibacter ginsenosidivorans]